MDLSVFDFDLPEALIARYPEPERTQSRLLVPDPATGDCTHHYFADIGQFLHPGDVLVVNNTRVMPARMFGRKASGGRIEVLVERLLNDTRVRAMVRASKPLRVGMTLDIAGAEVTVECVEHGFVDLVLASGNWLALMDAEGEMPLPPYMARPAERSDQSRYQTVYAKEAGAVAAPTAGLHFDTALLAQLRRQGIDVAEITLHVGAGTFLPVRVDDVRDHKMHSEYFEISQSVVDTIRQAKKAGRRVVAVGTTSLRALESASQTGEIQSYAGETDIFIYPGYQFRCVDALITNFHLPKSTLMMLVSAFFGLEKIQRAYQAAIESQYRFFSYGDAMFLARGEGDAI